MRTRLLASLALLVLSSPALAAGTAQVPEADNTMLFALGVLGVIVGRRIASKKSRPKDSEER